MPGRYVMWSMRFSFRCSFISSLKMLSLIAVLILFASCQSCRNPVNGEEALAPFSFTRPMPAR